LEWQPDKKERKAHMLACVPFLLFLFRENILPVGSGGFLAVDFEM